MKKIIDQAMESYNNREYDSVLEHEKMISSAPIGSWLLGEAYLKSDNNNNYKKAVEYLKCACDSNQFYACITLGFLFDSRNVLYNDNILKQRETSLPLSNAFFQKAFEKATSKANEGDGEAMRCLSFLYSIGFGCQQDFDKSFDWCKASFEHGVSTSVNDLILYHYSKHSPYYNLDKAKYYYSTIEDKKILNVDPKIIEWLENNK